MNVRNIHFQSVFKCQIADEDFAYFVAFSENTNFKYHQTKPIHKFNHLDPGSPIKADL